jgi:hypothetical protein
MSYFKSAEIGAICGSKAIQKRARNLLDCSRVILNPYEAMRRSHICVRIVLWNGNRVCFPHFAKQGVAAGFIDIHLQDLSAQAFRVAIEHHDLVL